MAFGNDDYYVGLAWCVSPDGRIKAQLGDRMTYVPFPDGASDQEIERRLRAKFAAGVDCLPAPAPVKSAKDFASVT